MAHQDKLETQPLLVDLTRLEPRNPFINRTLMFGESHRPDDLDDDWCYISQKNAEKRAVHATTLVIHGITNVYSLDINLSCFVFPSCPFQQFSKIKL